MDRVRSMLDGFTRDTSPAEQLEQADQTIAREIFFQTESELSRQSYDREKIFLDLARQHLDAFAQPDPVLSDLLVRTQDAVITLLRRIPHVVPEEYAREGVTYQYDEEKLTAAFRWYDRLLGQMVEQLEASR